MALSGIAKQVITLSQAIRDYWSSELPKRHPNYPLVNPSEDSGPSPPEEEQLRKLLKSQPQDVIYSLLLIMYLGRGDFGTDDLSGRYEYLKNTFAQPEWAISQMMGKAPLAEYLAEGLAELSRNGVDVDSLTFTHARSGN